MTEEQFAKALQKNGYGEGQFKDFPPNSDCAMHTHDASVMLMVVSGKFTLAREEGSTTYGPGEVCELAAGISHAEQTGPEGARILSGRK